MDKNIVRYDLLGIFKNRLGIDVVGQEEQPLFFLNSNFTPAQGAYLFALLYKKYRLDMKDIHIAFENAITFNGIVDYIVSHCAN